MVMRTIILQNKKEKAGFYLVFSMQMGPAVCATANEEGGA
jgi:hypothetical protein